MFSRLVSGLALWVSGSFSADGAILEECVATTQQQKPHLDFEDVSARIQIQIVPGSKKDLSLSPEPHHDADATTVVPEPKTALTSCILQKVSRVTSKSRQVVSTFVKRNLFIR